MDRLKDILEIIHIEDKAKREVAARVLIRDIEAYIEQEKDSSYWDGYYLGDTEGYDRGYLEAELDNEE